MSPEDDRSSAITHVDEIQRMDIIGIRGKAGKVDIIVTTGKLHVSVSRNAAACFRSPQLNRTCPVPAAGNPVRLAFREDVNFYRKGVRTEVLVP